MGGFAGGGSFILVPVYVTEISSDHVRGFLGSLTVLCHNIGILVAYIACSYANYYTVPYIGIVSSIVFTIWCLTIPESPKYLVEKGRLEESARAWEYFNDTKFVAAEHKREVMHGEKLSWKDFRKYNYLSRKAKTFVGAFLLQVNQLLGEACTWASS